MANVEAIFDFAAGAWNLTDANPAPLEFDSGTNGKIARHRFDDTTEEFVGEDVIHLPADLDSAGTVIFEAYGYAVTAAASKNIALKLYHSAKADGEDWDAAYASDESGDLATDGTQDELDFFSWTETVANLGWAASDHVRIKKSRIAPTVNNLVGDWGETHFRIRAPRA